MINVRSLVFGCGGLSTALESVGTSPSVGGESGWDFVADVAPRAVRAHLLPELCEEAGRGSVFTVLDVAPRFDAVGVTRSPRRNVGSRRGLVRWIRDFERNPRSPHLPDLVKLVHRTWRSPVDPAEVVLVRGFVRCLNLACESHRFRLLHRPRIRIEARASRVRALPYVLS
uniref:Uncharacterized protein n=1 Tax=Ananas comosus var. bracteatus TaxID=296719 RepID=A0A6V7NKD7_ANACO|nr:unnamed protein product [Ananas comosus var. bracteatus]